jgi:hypothetical protein
LRIASANGRLFQFYSPEDFGLLVFEPVSHANAVFGEPVKRCMPLGMRVLAGGNDAVRP